MSLIKIRLLKEQGNLGRAETELFKVLQNQEDKINRLEERIEELEG